MAKRGAGETGMTSGEKLLGGVALAVYVFVLPLTAEWLFNGAEKVFGVSLDPGLRDLAYYAALFGLVLIAFWGFFGRNTRAFFDRTWQVLGAAGVGLVAFYGLNEVTGRVLGLLRAGQVNLNDQAILARLGAAPRSTILMVVFLAPVVEETLFRGLLFGQFRGYSRPLAYVITSVFYALAAVWRYALDFSDPRYLLLSILYLPLSAGLTWCYDNGGSIWSCVALHAGFNGFLLFTAL